MSTIINNKRGFSLFPKLSNSVFTESREKGHGLFPKLSNNVSKKSREKGFTFIEVIVVAVIVLVLAGIAIPLYNGYIQSSRQEAVHNLAETAAAAANTFVRKKDEANLTLPALDLHYDNAVFNITIHKGSDEIEVVGYGKSNKVKYQ